MAIDSYVQVATDGSGKKIDMAQVVTAAGDPVYRQRAEITGDVADAILAMNATMRLQLAVMRGILFALTNGDVTEETFLD